MFSEGCRRREAESRRSSVRPILRGVNTSDSMLCDGADKDSSIRMMLGPRTDDNGRDRRPLLRIQYGLGYLVKRNVIGSNLRKF